MRARIRFRIDNTFSNDIGAPENFFHNLPCKRLSGSGIEQKMSESVQGDSRRTDLRLATL